MTEETFEATITVILGSGLDRVHTYEISRSPAALEKWMAEIVRPVFASIWKSQDGEAAFGLDNPYAVYNRDQVASVEIDFADAGESKELLQSMLRPEMGFKGS